MGVELFTSRNISACSDIISPSSFSRKLIDLLVQLQFSMLQKYLLIFFSPPCSHLTLDLITIPSVFLFQISCNWFFLIFYMLKRMFINTSQIWQVMKFKARLDCRSMLQLTKWLSHHKGQWKRESYAYQFCWVPLCFQIPSKHNTKILLWGVREKGAVNRNKDSVRWDKGLQFKVSKEHSRSCDLPWPNSLKIIPGQYRVQSHFPCCDSPWQNTILALSLQIYASTHGW